MTSSPFRRIDQPLFAQVADKARKHPRLRLNHNFHREQDPVQRFLNVLQPGTYVRPHRHRRDGSGTGFECFLVLQGAIGLLLFNADGEIQQQLHLSAAGPTHGIEVEEDQFHTLVALEADSVMFELKQGPYQPAQDKDFLSGFPQEGTPEPLCRKRSGARCSPDQAWRDASRKRCFSSNSSPSSCSIKRLTNA